MKRLLSLALPVVLATGMAAAAQSDTTPSPSSTNQATSPSSSSSTQSNTQNSSSTQANPATSSMSQSGTAATSQPSLEGCVIRQQTNYYLQPATGQPVKLNSSQDLSPHVGHRVRVEGNVNNGSASSGASGTHSTSGSNDTNTPAETSAGTQYQEINVTRVDMISESCPAGMQNQSTPGNNNTQSPKH